MDENEDLFWPLVFNHLLICIVSDRVLNTLFFFTVHEEFLKKFDIIYFLFLICNESRLEQGWFSQVLILLMLFLKRTKTTNQQKYLLRLTKTFKLKSYSERRQFQISRSLGEVFRKSCTSSLRLWKLTQNMINYYIV